MIIQHKFDERTKPHIFVGFTSSQKEYHIYDFKTHQIYISHDVIFYESIITYHDLSSSLLKNSITINLINDDITFDYSTTQSIVSTDVPSSDSIPYNLID